MFVAFTETYRLRNISPAPVCQRDSGSRIRPRSGSVLRSPVSYTHLDVYKRQYPHQVSGGQCQRAAIARALAAEPQLLICDEATSALDVTVQKQIMELLMKLKQEQNLSVIFICHDLALVQMFCDRVLVMNQGRIVETGTPDQIIDSPREEYTRMLVDAVLDI